MSLLDRYLPLYQFAERHGIWAHGSPDAIQAYDPSRDRPGTPKLVIGFLAKPHGGRTRLCHRDPGLLPGLHVVAVVCALLAGNPSPAA
jgi:hypothetical protein